MPAATHRKSKTALYNRWKTMQGRCRNPNHSVYRHYGARGIRVCDEWKDFVVFEAWALANGWRSDERVEIDRIDNSGHYCPANCRIVSPLVNRNNARGNVKVTAFGETKNVSEWWRDSRCPLRRYLTLLSRIQRYGWAPERAITQPC